MRLPNAPLIRGGDVSAEWRKALEAATGEALPRVPPERFPQRQWRIWLETVGGRRLPCSPIYGARGVVSDDWRPWFEEL